MGKLTREKAKALLKKSGENRAKKAAGRDFYSYLNPEMMKQHGLKIAAFKKDENPYFLNILPYLAGPHDPNCQENEDTYVLITKCHNIETANGRMNVICPRAMFPNKNLPCPICEKRLEVMQNDPENEKLIASLKVKERELYYIQNVTSVDEKNKGIQIMEVSAFFMGWKLKELVKPQKGGVGVKGSQKYIDISDQENGRTVKFKVSEKTTKDGTMPDWSAHELVLRDPIEDEIIDKILDLPPLDELITVKTYNELLALINNEEHDEAGNDKKEDSKKQEEKPKEKSSSSKKEFDYKTASAEELEEFIEDNKIKINEDDLGDERKMKIAVKKFLMNKDVSFKSANDIDDIDEYMLELEKDGNLIKFCKKNDIEFDEDDEEETKNKIERWYYENVD